MAQPNDEEMNILEELQSLRSEMDEMKKEMTAAASSESQKDGLNYKLSRLASSRTNTAVHAFQEFTLEEDTYSLMMSSSFLSRPWMLSFITAVIFQLGLAVLIGIQLLEHYGRNNCKGLGDGEDYCVPFDVPLTANIYVTIAQLITIVLVLATQSDLLTSLQTLSVLQNRKGVEWDKLIGEDGDRSCCLWIMRIFVPNFLKFLQSLAILFACFIIIVQSTDIIELLKDFSALLAISESDNIMFYLADMGFLGDFLAMKTSYVKTARIEIKKKDFSNRRYCKFTFLALRPFLFSFLCIGIVGAWLYVVSNQYTGEFLARKYPNCQVSGWYNLTLVGDGWCDNYEPYNTEQCGFDNGDCNPPISINE